MAVEAQAVIAVGSLTFAFKAGDKNFRDQDDDPGRRDLRRLFISRHVTAPLSRGDNDYAGRTRRHGVSHELLPMSVDEAFHRSFSPD